MECAQLKGLHAAISSKNVELVSAHLSTGCDVNAIFENETACTKAIISGENAVVQKIMRVESFDPNKGNSDDQSPLHVAAYHGNIEIVKDLLQRGAYVDSLDRKLYTPLLIAVNLGQSEVAKFLIDNPICKANVNHASFNGETALYIACNKVSYEMVCFLLENGANVNAQLNKLHPREGYTPLMEAVPSPYAINVSGKSKSTMIAIMKALLEHGCDVNAKDHRGESALHKATDFGDEHAVSFLAQYGADLQLRNSLGMTAFDNAIGPETQRYGVAISLLVNGYQPDASKEQLKRTFAALKHGENSRYFDKNDPKRKLLLELLIMDAYLDNEIKSFVKQQFYQQERSSDCLSILDDSFEYIESLQSISRRVIRRRLKTDIVNKIELLPIARSLKCYLRLNCYDPLKFCDLMLAISEEDCDTVEFFMKNHPFMNPNFSLFDKTPLTMAAKTGNEAIFEVLLTGGAKLNGRDSNGSTPLHEASAGGHLGIINIMVEHGADLNILNNQNESAVVKAAENGKFDVVCYLIKHGCSTGFKNKDGFHALHFASGSGAADATAALLTSGTSPSVQDPHLNTPLHVAVSEGVLYTSQGIGLPALFPTDAAMMFDALRNALCFKPTTKLFRESDYQHKVQHDVVVKLLLSHGADKSLQNANRKTPVDLVNEYHTNALTILELLNR